MEKSGRRPRGDTQQLILDYIRKQTALKGYPPSVREIGEAVGLKSTSTVHGHLIRLESKGLIRRDAMKPRAIDIRNNDHDASDEIEHVPVIGRVAAGSPILAEQDTDGTIPFPAFMTDENEYFVLAVRGNSMIGAGISDGDYVLVKRQNTANNGDIIAAMIDGDATVKRYFVERDCIRLQPENPDLSPIFSRDVTVIGKVTAVYHAIK